MHWDSGPHLPLPPWAPPGSRYTVALQRRARAVAAGLVQQVGRAQVRRTLGAPQRQQPLLHGGPEQRLTPPGAGHA